jgi:hypothetical protein
MFHALRYPSQLLLLAALAGCTAELEPEYFDGDRVGHVSFSPMFSAYDGVHEYVVTPSVPDAVDGPPFNGSPILASSIKWEIDDAFVSRGEFPDLPHAIKLTTKRAGTTTVTLLARHLSGPVFRQRGALTISRGTPEEWETGEARFKDGPRVSLPEAFVELDGGPCGLSEELSDPSNAACTSCHDHSNDSVEIGPSQSAGYSDSNLIEIISAGAKPAGGTFNSKYLRQLRMPDCVYRAFHRYDLSDDEKRGIVLKLRSLPRNLGQTDPGLSSVDSTRDSSAAKAVRESQHGFSTDRSGHFQDAKSKHPENLYTPAARRSARKCRPRRS